MHLTKRLCKQHLGWQHKILWQRKSRRREPRVVVAQSLKDKEIIDPVTAWKPVKERWRPPVDDPAWRDPEVKVNTAHQSRDWNEESTYVMLPVVRLMEGLKQAAILCKCQLKTGLPQGVSKLLGQLPKIPDQDALVQRVIMQSQKWDPANIMLPRRLDKEKPAYIFPREHGIPTSRSKEIMVRGLVRLCDTLYPKYPHVLTHRRNSSSHFISSNYIFTDDKRIVIQGELNRVITADHTLPPFADEDEIDKTALNKIDDMWPVAPTIDLRLQNLYTLKNTTGFLHNYSHGILQTLFINANDRWSSDQSCAVALMFCLGASLAQARQLYGNDVQTLPKPIAMQCVNVTSTSFNFVFFQLNTLNLSSMDGVKNLAFVDGDNVLYRRLLRQPWKRGEFLHHRYDSYDPKVFEKFLAVYLNGVPGIVR